MKDGLRFVDSDMHIMESPDLFDRYLDPKFKHRVSVAVGTDGRPNRGPSGLTLIDGLPTSDSELQQYRMRIRRGPTQSTQPLSGSRLADTGRLDFAVERDYNAEAQVMGMEQEGVDIAVLYPTGGLSLIARDNLDPQLSPEGRRLYDQNIPEAKRLLAEAGYAGGLKVPLEATLSWSPDYTDNLQVDMKNWKAAGIDTELKSKEFAAFMSTAIFGKFEKMAHSLRGGTPVADISLYAAHMPGQPLNASGVNDPKLTEMIRQQRRTYNVAKRREIVYDIQRYLAEQVYYHYDPSTTTVSAWEPYVKNFAPNIGHDYGGRLMVAWIDK